MPKKAKDPNKVVLLSEKPNDYQLKLKDRVLAATAEGITISDNLQPDNPIVYANEGFERLTGYSREDVLGRNCRFLQGAKTDQKTIEEIRRSIRNEQPCSVEILNYRKDGTQFWNLLSITPVRDESGKVTNFLGIQSDVTRRKNFENALYRVSARLEQTNQRMKKDLEDARQLQLAMLPDKLPQLPYADIAVAMRTAQEVGGDYYDFHLDDQDNLTFAIGDATGHGLKAGTIVTASKVLFNTYASLADPREILSKISAALKEMGFRNMYMAMLIAKISRDQIIVSSAGIPFTYLYRNNKKIIKELPLKGMPLGSFTEFVYESIETELNPGDSLLFHSDGLSECSNHRNMFYGEERIKAIFKETASSMPSKIIKNLTEDSSAWMGSKQPRDDITVVVMKMK